MSCKRCSKILNSTELSTAICTPCFSKGDDALCIVCQRAFRKKTLVTGICGRCTTKLTDVKSSGTKSGVSCVGCRKAFTERTLKKYGGRCKRCSTGTRSATLPAQTNTRSHRQIIWRRAFGTAGIAMCPLCNLNVIDPFTFEQGHDIAGSRGGTRNPENMLPVCRTCNSSQGTQRFAEFKASLGTSSGQSTSVFAPPAVRQSPTSGQSVSASAPPAVRQSPAPSRSVSMDFSTGTLISMLTAGLSRLRL